MATAMISSGHGVVDGVDHQTVAGELGASMRACRSIGRQVSQMGIQRIAEEAAGEDTADGGAAAQPDWPRRIMQSHASSWGCTP